VIWDFLNRKWKLLKAVASLQANRKRLSPIPKIFPYDQSHSNTEASCFLQISTDMKSNDV
jgi:hypothetical protein